MFKTFLSACFVILVIALFSSGVSAQKKVAKSAKSAQTPAEVFPEITIETTPELQTLVNRAAGLTIEKYLSKGFKSDDLAVTLIDVRDADNLKMGQFHGEQKIYPASVVKMFYMAAVHRWLQDGKIRDTPELRRGLKDMIVDSSNDATHYIVDVLTGTSGGGELPEKELAEFVYKRDVVDRYFASLGYKNIVVAQKTYCEDIYGRERQYRGKNAEKRNMLTTNATARLMAEIALGKMVNAAHSKQMMDLMKRDFETPRKNNDTDQDYDFTALGLKPGMKLWSKSGWTNSSRHDAAYVETPDGKKFVLVIFTTNHANEKDIIANITRTIVNGLK